METFAWVVLIILSVVGVAALIVLALPAFLECLKVLTYKCKKNVQSKKIDIDARDEKRRIRDAIKRDKEEQILNKKLELDLKKADIKIEQYQKKIDGADDYEEAIGAVTAQEVIDNEEETVTVEE